MFVETESRPAGEPAKVGTLKLSQAIRVGIRRFPRQCFGTFYQGEDAACAIGAAVYAKEGRATTGFHTNWTEYFGSPLVHEVAGKNDSGWTREQIADWLEAQGY